MDNFFLHPTYYLEPLPTNSFIMCLPGPTHVFPSYPAHAFRTTCFHKIVVHLLSPLFFHCFLHLGALENLVVFLFFSQKNALVETSSYNIWYIQCGIREVRNKNPNKRYSQGAMYSPKMQMMQSYIHFY